MHKHRDSHSDNRYKRQYPTTQDQYSIYIYIEDLEEFIKTQAGKQHQIVVMGDFNCDLNSKHNKMIQMMERYNIYNSIKGRYGWLTSTYEYGEKPLDGIFGSATISIQPGGHLPGNEISEHKLIRSLKGDFTSLRVHARYCCIRLSAETATLLTFHLQHHKVRLSMYCLFSMNSFYV